MPKRKTPAETSDIEIPFCAICQDAISDPALTSEIMPCCGESLHTACNGRWRESSDTCPLCNDLPAGGRKFKLSEEDAYEQTNGETMAEAQAAREEKADSDDDDDDGNCESEDFDCDSSEEEPDVDDGNCKSEDLDCDSSEEEPDVESCPICYEDLHDNSDDSQKMKCCGDFLHTACLAKGFDGDWMYGPSCECPSCGADCTADLELMAMLFDIKSTQERDSYRHNRDRIHRLEKRICRQKKEILRLRLLIPI
jgi:hypothetical protein